MRDYNDELLEMANDLAARLLPAFENTPTGTQKGILEACTKYFKGIPHPRVNLNGGFVQNNRNETCTAGAGSLLLEFGVLSRLLQDPTYEMLARRTNRALYNARDSDTGLLGKLTRHRRVKRGSFLSQATSSTFNLALGRVYSRVSAQAQTLSTSTFSRHTSCSVMRMTIACSTKATRKFGLSERKKSFE